MSKLKEIEFEYQTKLIDLKYQKAIALLQLIPNEDYMKLCEDNQTLFTPIIEQDGEAYLHQEGILDQMIALFTKYLKEQEVNLDKMDAKSLYMYITKNTENLDVERLRGIAKVIKNMLGL